MWQPDYTQLSSVKEYLRISDTLDDTDIQFAISAASRSIDRFCNRQFGQQGSAVTRYYSPARSYQFRHGFYFSYSLGKDFVAIDDLMDLTGLQVSVNGQAYTKDQDFYLEPYNALLDNRPYTRLSFTTPYGLNGDDHSVAITANWGWNSVPAEVTQAALIQTARLFKRREAPFGLLSSPDSSYQVRLLRQLDPDVQVLLSPFRKQVFA